MALLPSERQGRPILHPRASAGGKTDRTRAGLPESRARRRAPRRRASSAPYTPRCARTGRVELRRAGTGPGQPRKSRHRDRAWAAAPDTPVPPVSRGPEQLDPPGPGLPHSSTAPDRACFASVSPISAGERATATPAASSAAILSIARALAARDDRAGVAHALAGRRVLAGDEGGDRLLHVLLDEARRASPPRCRRSRRSSPRPASRGRPRTARARRRSSCR